MIGRRWTGLWIGSIALAGATLLEAFVEPRATAQRVSYVPAADAVVARVPRRDPAELALRDAPNDPVLAARVARIDIDRYRALSDPRYLGRAQATLAHWWTMAAPPSEIRLLRAIIEQSVHQFGPARADLDAVIEERPADAQALLTRAVVATVTADYVTARASCAAIHADPIVVATCNAPLDALADPDAAYEQLARSLRTPDPQLTAWALTTLAEIAVMRGHDDDAEVALRQVLAIDQDDHYARDALADVLIRGTRYAEASQLLAGREQIDSHLVRRAIAEHLGRGANADSLAAQMRDRIAAAAVRGDRVHVREEARFTLVVEGDSQRALALALENWGVQKELPDARLVVAAARAANQPNSAAPVREWMRVNHVRDAELGAAP